MERLIQVQQTFFPDLIFQMEKRYTILNLIDLLGPIGRRAIIETSKLPERAVRNEITFLQNHSFITVSTKGMEITEQGKQVVSAFAPYMNQIAGISSLEKQLSNILGINQVIIVKGNSEDDRYVKQELGRTVVSYLKNNIDSDVTIAVTGGTTMSSVASFMEPFGKHRCLFVPARGGTRENVENQANTIVAKMAEREKGFYRLLHVPDPLSEELYQTLKKEPSIEETLQKIENASIILHGLGEALTIAKRRNSSKKTIQLLKEKHAVGEVFGYYFNESGEIVHHVRTIGIQLDKITPHQKVVTVAGGKSKVLAIKAFAKLGISDVLITDEVAAKEIIKYYETLNFK